MKRWTLSPSDKGAVENSSIASSTAVENVFQSTFLVLQRALRRDASLLPVRRVGLPVGARPTVENGR